MAEADPSSAHDDAAPGEEATSEEGHGRSRSHKSPPPRARKSARPKSGGKAADGSARHGEPDSDRTEGQEAEPGGNADGRSARPFPDHERRHLTGAQAARRAAQELVELTSKDLEGVVGIRKDGDSWKVEIEALEMRRIPSTTDVLAVYEVSLDAEGELVGYQRVARYVRGNAGEDRS
jgi:hypothetical protein